MDMVYLLSGILGADYDEAVDFADSPGLEDIVRLEAEFWKARSLYRLFSSDHNADVYCRRMQEAEDRCDQAVESLARNNHIPEEKIPELRHVLGEFVDGILRSCDEFFEETDRLSGNAWRDIESLSDYDFLADDEDEESD